MTDTVIVNLPFFPGFYESTLSWVLDSVEEREAEYYTENAPYRCPETLEMFPQCGAA